MTDESQHALFLGALDLIGRDFSNFTIETIAEGMDFGGASPVDVITESLLQDGASVTTERWENREITFGVLISGPDLIAVAEGEAALYAELGRRNTLSWTPPDGWGPTTVFDVVTSWADFDFDDWGEMEPGAIGRRFVIRLTCAPFARSDSEIEVAAIGTGETPPTPNTVTVDDCSSLTGWSGTPNTPTVSGGTAIREAVGAAGAGPAIAVMTLTRTGLTADLTATPFLRITVSNSGASVPPAALTTKVNGAIVTPVARADNDLYFYLPGVIVNTIEWSATQTYVRPGSAQISVSDISRTNVIPFVGTGRQLFRSISVKGSARTQGSIQIEHETSSLGEVLAYTNADDRSGYQPACRRYRTTGGTITSDAATASGSYEPLNSGTPFTCEIPGGALPAGSYSIMGRIRGDTTAITGVTWAASTLVGSTLYATQSSSIILLGGTSTTWRFYEIARVTLPPDDLPPGTTQKVRVTLSSANTIYLDDLYLFNTDVGHLTWVDCGSAAPSTGGSSNRLWIDTATLDRPRQSIWMGTAADGSDRRHALGSEVRSLGTHVLAPGDLNLFTVTSNALNAAASARYYPRWPNNAGLIAA